MKIVMVGPFGLKTKSTMRERALPMARALLRRGHTVTMILPPWDNPEDAGKSYLDGGVQIINAQLPRVKGGFFFIALTATLVRLSLQQNPDVIHLFKPKAYAGLAHLLLHTLRKFGRHNVRLVVDEDDWERAWNDIEPYTPAQKRLFAWQEPWGITHADAVTVASKNLQYYAETLGVAQKNIAYVPNGVRAIKGSVDILPTFELWQSQLANIVTQAGVPLMPPVSTRGRDFGGKIRTELGLTGIPIVLLYTRFFEFQLDFLLAVIKDLHARMPLARWLIVGKGFFGEEETLAAMVQKAGLTDKVIFSGWVDMADLPHYFAAANVAVYPYDDTPVNRTKCSVKLLDLLSAGVPVVASKVGQNIEYIRHRQSGILVSPDNPTMMAQAVTAILSSSATQRLLGQDAARDVNHRFNWNTLAISVEKLYAQL